MAITTVEPLGAAPGYWFALRLLVRAAAGLVACGLRHFGRPSCIERRTGVVRPA